MILKENLHFLSKDHFYSEGSKIKHHCENLIFAAFCHENLSVSQSSKSLAIAQTVNSKMELARHAEIYDLPIPSTLVSSKKYLNSDEVLSFIEKYNSKVILKISGLGGALNVRQVSTPEEALEHLNEFPDETEIILQEQLDLSKYREMTVDFVITDKECRIDNIRDVLVVDGAWVGNHLQKDISLSKSQEETLLRCAKWLQDEGYSHPNGYLCGANFFLSDDDLKVIEINGRWTGGQVVKRIQKKLAVGAKDVYAFIDKLSPKKFEDYKNFMSEHLYTVGEQVDSFKVLPLGFNPFIEKGEFLLLWVMVIGNMQDFIKAKEKVFGEGELPTSEKVAATALGAPALSC